LWSISTSKLAGFARTDSISQEIKQQQIMLNGRYAFTVSLNFGANEISTLHVLLVFSVWQNQVRLSDEIKVKYFQEIGYKMADLAKKAQNVKCHSEVVGLLNVRMTHNKL
jgi:hypothetical protein